MRRRTRKALLQLVLFFGVLVLIIFLNRPQTSKSFAWNKVRYKPSSATSPSPRGICPGLSETSKPALVVARVSTDGDSKWLDSLADLYHICVYTADAPADSTSTYLQVPANRGHEAMAYLTFLIDNYEDVPTKGVVFVHGSRWAWHNDSPEYDNAALLARLNISTALAESGYHNLRCDWSLSTCPLSTPPQGSIETSMQAVLEPWDSRAVSDAALPHALDTLFGGEEHASSTRGNGRSLLRRTDAIRAQCCAQFVVDRDRVMQHTREEYVALRQWLLDDNAAPLDDRIAGRILSYVWHILFIKQDPGDDVNLERLNNMACPSASDCYCRLYGRCRLENCNDGMCHGQYKLPPDLKLPANWATTHS